MCDLPNHSCKEAMDSPSAQQGQSPVRWTISSPRTVKPLRWMNSRGEDQTTAAADHGGNNGQDRRGLEEAYMHIRTRVRRMILFALCALPSPNQARLQSFRLTPASKLME